MAKKNILLRPKFRKAQELAQCGQFDQAGVLLEKLSKSIKRDPQIFALLGFVNAKTGKPAASADCYRKALALSPNDAQLLYNLGTVLLESGDLPAAAEVLRKVLLQQPRHRDAANSLAHVFIARNQLDDAEVTLRKALQHHPRDAELHSNLGAVLKNSGFVDRAAECFEKALSINPQLPTYTNYAATLSDQGKFTESIAAYREGLHRRQHDPSGYSNMLLTLNYMSDTEPEVMLKEHRGWIKTLGNRIPQITRHDIMRDANKRLRIGYVSADFRTHSVASYVEPLLAAHPRENTQLYCYASVPRPDETTQRLKSLADHWRDTHTFSPQQLAKQIISDHIDILVDLAGHTAHNQLPAFALKPAPVQVTYLGYPNTTGLDTMDYRLTDSVADPQGAEDFYSEELVRLPGCFLCYQPPAGAPDVAPPPATATGLITFGSFNNLSKMNPDVIALWSEILKAVPGSRMLLKNPALTDPARQVHYLTLFEKYGIQRDRIELKGHTPTREAHLAVYADIDVALDTFPYNGTTTTCEALYMGVPVVTLSGDVLRSRVGESLLKAVHKAEWVAANPETYVAIAAAMSTDAQKLADIRRQLREQLLASTLCDAETFTRNLEEAYRFMWRQRCTDGE